MTLGEKIREARKGGGLSQEQLAQMLCVSRSAVAKWETDKGLPDIGNLKMLAKLLKVSVDSLLEEQPDQAAVIREPYNLAAYGRGCKKVKKDRFLRERFPDARICPLLGRPELSMAEQIKRMKDPDQEFYLVETEEGQYFVTVADAFMEMRQMTPMITENSFFLGGWSFIRCNYEVK